MGKKQKQSVTVAQPVKVIVEESKQDLVQKANSGLEKYLPHEKYIIKKTKLITKKKNQAIAFIKMDKFQVAKAVQCLKEFDKNNQSLKNLFTQDGFIYLQFDLSKVPEHYSIRPVQIQLPHPIYSQKYNSRFAILSTDPQSTFTDKIQDMNIPQISQVIGYEKIKKNYKQNIDKLKLIAANDLFFCDWKIYNLLRQPLGKVFYDKKKYPFPIDCENVPEDLKEKFKTYEEYVNDLGNHTYFMMGNGPVYSIKIGRVSMQSQQLVKNIMRGIFRTIPYILGSELTPKDIRQITIKTFNSPSLPIYNFLDQKYVNSYKLQQKSENTKNVDKNQKKQQRNVNVNSNDKKNKVAQVDAKIVPEVNKIAPVNNKVAPVNNKVAPVNNKVIPVAPSVQQQNKKKNNKNK